MRLMHKIILSSLSQQLKRGVSERIKTARRGSTASSASSSRPTSRASRTSTSSPAGGSDDSPSTPLTPRRESSEGATKETSVATPKVSTADIDALGEEVEGGEDDYETPVASEVTPASTLAVSEHGAEEHGAEVEGGEDEYEAPVASEPPVAPPRVAPYGSPSDSVTPEVRRLLEPRLVDIVLSDLLTSCNLTC
jgi:hypothetical protein